MDVAAWLRRATEDAEARGLPQLKPLLESLARSTETLRAAAAAEYADHADRDAAEHAGADDHD